MTSQRKHAWFLYSINTSLIFFPPKNARGQNDRDHNGESYTHSNNNNNDNNNSYSQKVTYRDLHKSVHLKTWPSTKTQNWFLKYKQLINTHMYKYTNTNTHIHIHVHINLEILTNKHTQSIFTYTCTCTHLDLYTFINKNGKYTYIYYIG